MNKKFVQNSIIAAIVFIVSFSVLYDSPVNKVYAQTDLCAAGGEAADNVLTAGETSFDNTAVEIVNCAFTIDGAHTFTSLTVGDSSGTNDSVLRHSQTDGTTVFGLDITTTANFTVNSDADINVNGRGFLGGRQPGNANELGRTTGNSNTNASSHRSGGSHGGLGGFENVAQGITYGDLTNPTEPGGGGGAENGAQLGGDGGGLVRLNVGGTLTLDGDILANGNSGGSFAAGGGAGGGIYLNVDTLAGSNGSSTITVNGGNGGTNGPGGGGGGGRIAIIYDTNTYPGSYQAFGALKSSSGDNGGAGTIYLKDNAVTNGNLILDNNNIVPPVLSTPLPSTPTVFNTLVLSRDARASSSNITEVVSTFSLDDAYFNRLGISSITAPAVTANNGSVLTVNELQIPTINITNSSTLRHNETNGSTVYDLDITATTMNVDSSSAINLIGRGFLGGRQPGNATETARTTGNSNTNASSHRTGGSYGGLGGFESNAQGITYGDLTNPTEPGGGGGAENAGQRGGDGGGLIRVVVSGTLTLDGDILANGNSGGSFAAGGGAGGGIYLNVGTLAGSNGSSIITVNGGNGGTDGPGGGGGGGRIAIIYDTNTYSGSYQAFGALKSSSGDNGGAGTIYLKDNAVTNGDLILDNNNLTPAALSTPLPSTPTVFNTLVLTRDARASSSTMSEVISTFTLDDSYFNRLGIASITAPALTINNGSVFTANDIQIPIINITNSSTLRHNQTNSSTVYDLDVTATTLTIDSTSAINLNGRGFLGGRQPGNATEAGRTTGNSNTNASSHRSGGSYGGLGGFENVAQGIIYGDLTNPTEPGGGGGAENAAQLGGDGGGIVRLNISGTFTLDGDIIVNGNSGGSFAAGGGAGGGVYLNVGTLAGSDSGSLITVNGGNAGTNGPGGGGAGGRIAVIFDTNTYSGSYQAFGASKNSSGDHGGAGTIYLKDNAVTNGDLTIDNNNLTVPEGATPLPSTPTVFNSIAIAQLARVRSDYLTQVVGPFTIDNGRFTYGNTAATLNLSSFDMSNGALLNARDTNQSTIYSVDLSATSMSVDSSSSINMNGRGFLGGRQPGNPNERGRTTGNSNTNASSHRSGGSHGGRGGFENVALGIAYGDLTNPTEPGGGGGAENGAQRGGDGGGLIRIVVSGTLTLDGDIVANGNSGGGFAAGGGAGGGIYLNVGTLTGSDSGSVITVNGGNAGTNGPGGGGGGGRIAIIYDANTYPGSYRSYGANRSSSGDHGAGGTIFLKDKGLSDGNLTVNNNSLSTPSTTPLFVSGVATATYTFIDLSVLNLADLLVDSPGTCTPNALIITGVVDLSGSGVITNNLSGTCPIIYPGTNVTTLTLPPVPAGTAYSTFLSAIGFAPFSWDCIADPGCGSSFPTGLSLNAGTGEISGTTAVLGSFPFTIEVTDSDPGGPQIDTQALTLNVSNVPLAPTSLETEGASNPVNVEDLLPSFSAIFSDPDGGDTANEFRIQVDDNNDFSSILWDSGLTSFGAPCVNGNRCFADFGGAPFDPDGTQYFWRIRYVDQLGLIGPWSEDPISTNSFTMILNVAPDAPTSLKVNNQTNPDFISDEFPDFRAFHSDSNGHGALQYYVEVDDNDDFSSPIWGSGNTNFPSLCPNNSACGPITFGGAPLDQDGSTYYWRIKFSDEFAVFGPWSEDPISTNFFTMFDIAAGGARSPAAGGGGGGASSAGGASGAASYGTAPVYQPPEEIEEQIAEQQQIMEEVIVVEPVCGNSTLEAGEQCDDGNLESHDGCSDICQIDEVVPEAELQIIDVLFPARTHGLLITFQVIGMAGGELSVHKSGDFEEIMSVEYIPNVQTTLEIPTSLLRSQQSFDYSRIFYEISKQRELNENEYNEIFRKAIEEGEITIEIVAESADGEVSAEINVEFDNFPPTTSIDTPSGTYSKPLNVNISAN